MRCPTCNKKIVTESNRLAVFECFDCVKKRVEAREKDRADLDKILSLPLEDLAFKDRLRKRV